MNIQQMHIEFREASDRLDSSAFADLLPEQTDYILNEAIQRYTKQKYEKFEIEQRSTEDLKNLIVTEFPTITTIVTETNVYKADLSNRFTNEALATASTTIYWYWLRGRARIVKTGCISKYVGIKIYSHDDLNEVLEDPFKKPYLNEVVGYFEAGNLYVVTDSSFTIDRVKLSFNKKPTEVRYGSIYPTPVSNIDCDLSDQTHKEIIQMAVIILLEYLESQRLQTAIGIKQVTD